jgi:glucan 1,3-beta-glucosidase
VIHEIIALAKRDNFRVNVIEAFDQPWKRRLEGTVGGHWGLFDAYSRMIKFGLGRAEIGSSVVEAAGGGRGR